MLCGSSHTSGALIPASSGMTLSDCTRALFSMKSTCNAQAASAMDMLLATLTAATHQCLLHQRLPSLLHNGWAKPTAETFQSTKIQHAIGQHSLNLTGSLSARCLALCHTSPGISLMACKQGMSYHANDSTKGDCMLSQVIQIPVKACHGCSQDPCSKYGRCSMIGMSNAVFRTMSKVTIAT